MGLLLYFDESSYKDVITNSVEATVSKKYHNNTTATVQTFDLIQEGVRSLAIKQSSWKSYGVLLEQTWLNFNTFASQFLVGMLWIKRTY